MYTSPVYRNAMVNNTSEKCRSKADTGQKTPFQPKTAMYWVLLFTTMWVILRRQKHTDTDEEFETGENIREVSYTTNTPVQLNAIHFVEIGVLVRHENNAPFKLKIFKVTTTPKGKRRQS